MRAESFVFYKSWYDAIKKLPTDKDKADAYTALCAYAYGVDNESNGGYSPYVEMLLEIAKPVIDASYQRYVTATNFYKNSGIGK